MSLLTRRASDRTCIEYLEGGGEARCTATGFAIPEGAIDSVEKAETKYHDRFKYISGKFFNEITNDELGLPAKGEYSLITDLNGVLYYTKTLVEDLRRYLELLGIGGLLFFTDISADITAPNAIQNKRCSWLAKWASNIAGVRVKFYSRSPASIEIEKTDDRIIIPDMTLDKYETQSANSPKREYSCIHLLPNNPNIKA